MGEGGSCCLGKNKRMRGNRTERTVEEGPREGRKGTEERGAVTNRAHSFHPN